MTQAEKLGQELQKLKLNITTQDKKDACRKFNVHTNTVQNYLRGEGRDAGLAAKMIAFYKKQIDKRNQVLA